MVRTAQADLVGRTLGDFEIRERVSTGGMGTVYKAYQRGMARVVALKVLPDELADNPVALQRFYQEARSAARLDHPNIVRAIAAGEQDGLHFFAMEFVEGDSLARRLKRSGRLDEAKAVAMITAVAEALAAAHAKGIIHRDVKPENVLLTKDGPVKLADFGLVKRLDQDLGLTDAGKGLGTTNYMAPEQFKDAKNADLRCDIYGLGTTLYAALSGVTPWAGVQLMAMYKQKMAGNLPPLRQARPEITERTESVVSRAMSVDPSHRQASCAEFVAQLGVQPSKPMPQPVDNLPTRAVIDLASESALPSTREATEEFWHVRFFEKGQRKQLKLRAQEIRQGVKSGRIADDIRIARSENGPWLRLHAFSEFVDLAAQLSRGTKEVEMESDIQRTVAALHAGAPLRRRERKWGLIVAASIFVLTALGLAFWLSHR